MVREFARPSSRPSPSEIDENHTLPQTETWDKIVELGLPGIPFPEELGGSGRRHAGRTSSRSRRSARVCGFDGTDPMRRTSASGPTRSTPGAATELRESYVPKLIAGEYMGAYGLTEPGAGSDSGGTQTTAVLSTATTYVLNGRKCFITNANHAGVSSCTAVTDKSLGAEGHQRLRRTARHGGLQPGEGRGQAGHARLGLGQPRLRGRAHPVATICSVRRARASPRS